MNLYTSINIYEQKGVESRITPENEFCQVIVHNFMRPRFSNIGPRFNNRRIISSPRRMAYHIMTITPPTLTAIAAFSDIYSDTPTFEEQFHK